MSRSQINVLQAQLDRVRANPLYGPILDFASRLVAQIVDQENRIEALERAIKHGTPIL